MLKQLLIAFFLFLSINLSSQTEQLPESILIEYHFSGESRKKGKLSFYSKKDSILFTYNKKIHSYQGVEQYSIKKEINRRGKLVYDSLKIIPIDLVFKEKLINQFLSLLDTNQYYQPILFDSFTNVDSNKVNVVKLSTPLVPHDFSSKYYIDTLTFNKQCEYYKNQLSFRYSNSDLPLNRCIYNREINIQFINKLILSNTGIHVSSSHSEYLSITFQFDKHNIIIDQIYLGNLNSKWYKTITNKEEKIELLNPKINELIHMILPNNIKGKEKLMEFKDIRELFELYLYVG